MISRVTNGFNSFVVFALLHSSLFILFLFEGVVEVLACGHATGTSIDGFDRNNIKKTATIIPPHLLLACQSHVFS